MSTINNGIGCTIIGSEKEGQLAYGSGLIYNIKNQWYTNSNRLRDNDYYTDFDFNFFPIAESGAQIYSITGGGSGNLLPDRTHFKWTNYHRTKTNDGGYYQMPFGGVNFLETPTQQGYIDLDTTFDLNNYFTLYFNIASGEGTLYSRGLPSASYYDNLEFEVKVGDSWNVPGAKMLWLVTNDAYGGYQWFTYDFYEEQGQTSHLIVHYSGNLTDGYWSFGEIDTNPLSLNYNSYRNILSYRVNPRKNINGAKSRLFKTITGGYLGANYYKGLLCEFGAVSGFWDYDSRLMYRAKTGGSPFYSMYYDGNSSTDQTYLGEYFPMGSGAISERFVCLLDPDAGNLYQWVNPSASRSVLCVEHNTSHSGLYANIAMNFTGGYSPYGSWTATKFIPSGSKQEITIFPDSTVFYNGGEILVDDITSISVQIDFTYDANRNIPYYGDLKLYSYRFEADGWCVAETGDATITLYQGGKAQEAYNYTDLFLFNQQGTMGSGISLYIDNKESNGGIDLFTTAHDISNQGAPLYSIAFLTQNSGVPLTTSGRVYSYDNMTLHAQGPRVFNVNGSGSLSMFTWATANSGNAVGNGISLYTFNEGYANPLYFMPLYTTGPTNTQISAVMPLHVADNGIDVSKSLDLFLLGPSGYNSSIPLYITTPGVTEGYYPASMQMPLIMARDYESFSKHLPLVMSAPGSSTKGMELYTSGRMPVHSGTINLYASGTTRQTGSITLFNHGF